MSEPSVHRSLDERKAAILRAVVQEHITTGQPVGSGTITSGHGLGVSAATVRNEMSVLEREGYLTHPHTSAGRIPTDKGYRFYVDSLTSPGTLPKPKLAQVSDFFHQAHGELEQMLTRTSKLLAGLTDYAAVVVGPAHEVATIRSVQVVGLGGGNDRDGHPIEVALVVVVLSNGVVEKHTVELEEGTGDQRLAAVSAHLSGQLIGRTLASATAAPLLQTGEEKTDRACDRAIVALRPDPEHRVGDSDVFVGGTSRMVSAFDAIETIRNVLTVLEQQYVVVTLLKEVMARGPVSIGAEHAGTDAGFQSLSTCSVVVAPYLVDGQPAGTIGVLGPTRMNYPEAMAAVTAVSEGLSERLSDS